MQSNKQARGVNQQITSVAVFLRDGKPDALDKITILFIKIQNTNTLDVKICPQSCLLFVCGQVGGNRSIFRRAAVSAVSSSRRTRLQLGRESQRRYGGNRITESGRLQVNYFCLMFNFYF